MSGRLQAKGFAILEGVEPHVVEPLLLRARQGQYAQGEELIRAHDPGFGLLFVFSGSVKVFFTSADGHQVMVRLVHGPGVVACAPGTPANELVTALEPTE